MTDKAKQSLVYLDISNSRYEQYQPWRQTEISKDSGYGCAVSAHQILTTAENVMHASYVQARVYGQNTFVNTTVSVIDYEYNLCLLDLDPNGLSQPLVPVTFTELYPKGESLTTYWLSGGGHLTTARSMLDRAEMDRSPISFASNLFFYASNPSRPFGDGEICAYDKDIIGLACWGSEIESGIIPAETINRFLKHSRQKEYSGFASVGFETFDLLDPTMRHYLKMPENLNHGVYVNSVFTVGTGSNELKHGDVVLSIDGHTLNPYGRYEHPEYDRISFYHLILQHPESDPIPFEIFRDGKQLKIDVKAKTVESSKMLVPYYIYGKQPEYIVTGGYIFQQLTRDYLTMWGNDWTGKVPPHLLHYYADLSMKPTPQRQEIVVLNYVLPAPINLGYQDLSRMVVEAVNGQKISSVNDFYHKLTQKNDSEFIVITFEMDSPALVIPKSGLDMMNQQIAQIYGIPKLSNITE